MRHTINQVIRHTSRLLPGVRTGVALSVLVLVAILAPRGTRSQTSGPANGATSKPIPQRIVYRQVFRHVVFLDQQAGLAVQNHQDSSQFSNFYQAKAGLTATETALLKATAHDAATAIQAIDQQIQAVVVTYRAQLPSNRLPSKGDLPALPPELKTLQAAKDQAVLDHVTSLQTGFGTDRFQHFDSWVQSAITPHITVAQAPAKATQDARSVKQPPQATTVKR